MNPEATQIAMPYDYCVTGPYHVRQGKGTEHFPKFLRRLGRGLYQMVPKNKQQQGRARRGRAMR
jgi:hypothetical protein